MTGRLCAICVKRTADRVDAELGASICRECDEGEIRCINSDRRCEPSGGIGYTFALEVAEKYRRVVPERILRLDEAVDHSIPHSGPPDHGRVWWDDSLSPNQEKYIASSRSRGRGGRS